MAKSNKKWLAHVKILQNGYVIAEGKYPLAKRAHVKISNRSKSQLYIPLFPLADDITLFKIRGQKLYLTLGGKASGFLVKSSKTIAIKAHDHSERRYSMALGDYASFLLANLRVMIKVEAYPKAETFVKKGNYRGSFSKIFISSAKELRILVLSTVLGSMFFALCYFLLTLMAPEIPKTYAELRPFYTLPFLADESLKTAPEALQGRLDRSRIVAQTIRLYTKITEVAMGWSFREDPMIFSSSLALFSDLYEKQEKKLENKVTLQEVVEEQDKRLFATKTLKIPAVHKESFQSKLLFGIELVDNMHQSYKLALDLRRKASKAFLGDPVYDWGQYKTDKSSTKEASDAQIAKEMSKITVFNQRTNEQMMYDQAALLGETALLAQKRVFGDRPLLLLDNIEEIHLHSGNPSISFLRPEEVLDNEETIASIHALRAERQSVVERDLVIGIPDEEGIKKIIAEKKFELGLCYELALRRNQKLKGEMQWQWNIDIKGQVFKIILLESSLKDEQMARCIENKMASWAFPKPRNGSIRVSHSFAFRPYGE